MAKLVKRSGTEPSFSSPTLNWHVICCGVHTSKNLFLHYPQLLQQTSERMHHILKNSLELPAMLNHYLHLIFDLNLEENNLHSHPPKNKRDRLNCILFLPERNSRNMDIVSFHRFWEIRLISLFSKFSRHITPQYGAYYAWLK
ncbi:hypothetical protein tloyanaT_15790 [Thalassotalea loyana]|uniref:Uncharacterized protein n=1 Tax=Thalassotalea loyana TaxID=280483 RepID=A0ABQ6HCL2_9GAMM|nr:hypothetical protein tloyanaT_15790 [Thalassotalea loyana]